MSKKKQQAPAGRDLHQYAVGTEDDFVILAFPTSVSWIGLHPAEAVALAQALTSRAELVLSRIAGRTGTH